MEIRTCEEFVIDELDRARDELGATRALIGKLKDEIAALEREIELMRGR